MVALIIGRTSDRGLLPRPKGGKGPGPAPFIPVGAGGNTDGGPRGGGT